MKKILAFSQIGRVLFVGNTLQRLILDKGLLRKNTCLYLEKNNLQFSFHKGNLKHKHLFITFKEKNIIVVSLRT